MFKRRFIIAAALIVTGNVLAQEAPAVDQEIDLGTLPTAVEGFKGVTGDDVFQDGRVFVCGQPGEESLRQFAEAGVTAVINLRTPAETDDRERVPFDEAEVVKELGMEYVHIPLGGEDYPYTPAAVAEFAATMSKHEGPVLVHCTVGWRASYIWVAYLIEYQGFPLDLALARGEAIAISPTPLEGFLAKPLTLTYKN